MCFIFILIENVFLYNYPHYMDKIFIAIFFFYHKTSYVRYNNRQIITICYNKRMLKKIDII